MPNLSRRPKVYFLGEPDSFLSQFLQSAQIMRVYCSEDVDFVLYPILLRGDKNHILSKNNLPSYDYQKLRSSPIVVFVLNDFDVVVTSEHITTIVYRTGLSRFWRLPNEHVLPFIWVKQPVDFNPRSNNGKPVVGFCGTLLKRRSRQATLEYFSKNDAFNCSYIIRNQFGGAEIDQIKAVIEYYNNLDSSDFIICDRGRGNWTMRLYETLSKGRIPVMLDSGFVLPQIKHGSWDNTILVARTRDELAKKVMQAWTSGEMEARQQRCRALWQDNLSMLGFAKKFSEDLVQLSENPEKQKKYPKYKIKQKLMYYARYALYR